MLIDTTTRALTDRAYIDILRRAAARHRVGHRSVGEDSQTASCVDGNDQNKADQQTNDIHVFTIYQAQQHTINCQVLTACPAAQSSADYRLRTNLHAGAAIS